MSLLNRRVVVMVRLNGSLNLRMCEDLPIRDDPLLARIIDRSCSNLRAHIGILVSVERAHGDIVAVCDLGEAGAVPPGTSVARPGTILPSAAVLADEAGKEARGDGFEGWDGGGENPHVCFDDGPVHGAADCVGIVCGGEHGRDVGDSDDGGDAGTVVLC